MTLPPSNPLRIFAPETRLRGHSIFVGILPLPPFGTSLAVMYLRQTKEETDDIFGEAIKLSAMLKSSHSQLGGVDISKIITCYQCLEKGIATLPKTLPRQGFLGASDTEMSTASSKVGCAEVRSASIATDALRKKTLSASYAGFKGTKADEAAYGQAGNDILNGRKGADRLFGGSGNDTLSGGNDDDFLNGGAGDDTLAGGNGDDIYYFGPGGAHDTIDNASNPNDTDLVQQGRMR